MFCITNPRLIYYIIFHCFQKLLCSKKAFLKIKQLLSIHSETLQKCHSYPNLKKTKNIKKHLQLLKKKACGINNQCTFGHTNQVAPPEIIYPKIKIVKIYILCAIPDSYEYFIMKKTKNKKKTLSKLLFHSFIQQN